MNFEKLFSNLRYPLQEERMNLGYIVSSLRCSKTNVHVFGDVFIGNDTSRKFQGGVT